MLTATRLADSMVAFFFFQAEDGIRDWSVTGVQTCALPISRRSGGGVPSTTSFRTRRPTASSPGSPRSEERREGKSVDLGGRRISKKKNEGGTRRRDSTEAKLMYGW